MKVFIFGIKGNMGRRYAAILKFLNIQVSGCDADDFIDSWLNSYADSDAVIVATPTTEHLCNLRFLAQGQKLVLCEKPITTNIKELRQFLPLAEQSNMKLSMVSQYDYLDDRVYDWEGKTYYDYFKSGNDGLAWDCINIIWCAKGKISLKNESPIWSCGINGRPLRLELMDFAYIHMIEDWLSKSYEPQYDRILKSHEKVLDFLDGKFN